MPEVKSQEEKCQPRRNTGRNSINLGWFLLSPLTSTSIFVPHIIQNLFHCSYILCTLLDSNFYKMPRNILAPALFSMCLHSGLHGFQRYPVSPQSSPCIHIALLYFLSGQYKCRFLMSPIFKKAMLQRLHYFFCFALTFL